MMANKYGTYAFANFPEYDLTDKKRAYNDYVRYFMARTNRIFKYENLPDTIPAKELEIQLQAYGHCGVFEYQGKLYALRGNMGGKANAYYLPTKYIITNPNIPVTKEFKINTFDKDNLVVAKNDSLYIGLMPLIGKTSKQLVENDISLMMANINSRMSAIISAADDPTVAGIKDYVKAVVDGKLSIAIADSKFFESLKVSPVAQAHSNENITDLLEFNAFLQGYLFKMLGIPFSTNKKREAVLSAEVEQDDNSCRPFIDDMLETRKEWVQEVNDMFGTNITVDFNGVWKKLAEEREKEEEEEEEEVIEEEEIIEEGVKENET